MFELILTITDPEDGAYFINKALNRLHGYLRHSQQQLAIIFHKNSIHIYHPEQTLLQDLLNNDALKNDVRRQIFNAKINNVTDEEIQVYERVRDINPHKKMESWKKYCKNREFDFSEQKSLSYYQKKQKEMKQKQKKAESRYFCVRHKDKRFTLYIESTSIRCADFNNLKFSSYGMLITQKNNKFDEVT